MSQPKIIEIKLYQLIMGFMFNKKKTGFMR